MAQPKIYERQVVTGLEYEGHGIAKPEGRVVFIEGALPGDEVDIRLTRTRKSHAFAVVTCRHADSPLRVAPFCPHFDDCGGCTWQYLGYEHQLEWKQSFVAEVLERLGGIREPAPLPIIGCETDRYYRNKLEFSFSATRWLTQEEIDRGGSIADRRALGFHVKGRYDRVLDLDTCFLQADPSNGIRNEARRIALAEGLSFHDPATHQGFLRSLIVRTSTSGEVMVILVVGEERPETADRFVELLSQAVPAITSAHVVVNPTRNDDIGPHPARHVCGSATITEGCGPLRLAIHPKSFYQTNSRQAERLYGVVRDWALLTGSETVLDLYCGIGSIGLYLADRAARVIGFEYVSEATDRARENAVANGLNHAEFHAGDVRELLRQVPASLPHPDLVVLDPPRAGVHPDVIDELIRIRPRQIIYVSCKPSTQARDLARLCAFYTIERIQPVDMFPQTFHIENVVDLRRRGR